jgi:hypothetical protein
VPESERPRGPRRRHYGLGDDDDRRRAADVMEYLERTGKLDDLSGPEHKLVWSLAREYLPGAAGDAVTFDRDRAMGMMAHKDPDSGKQRQGSISGARVAIRKLLALKLIRLVQRGKGPNPTLYKFTPSRRSCPDSNSKPSEKRALTVAAARACARNPDSNLSELRALRPEAVQKETASPLLIDHAGAGAGAPARAAATPSLRKEEEAAAAADEAECRAMLGELADLDSRFAGSGVEPILALPGGKDPDQVRVACERGKAEARDLYRFVKLAVKERWPARRVPREREDWHERRMRKIREHLASVSLS